MSTTTDEPQYQKNEHLQNQLELIPPSELIQSPKIQIYFRRMRPHTRNGRKVHLVDKLFVTNTDEVFWQRAGVTKDRCLTSDYTYPFLYDASRKLNRKHAIMSVYAVESHISPVNYDYEKYIKNYAFL